VQLDGAVAEAALVDQLERHAHAVGQRPLPAADDDRRERNRWTSSTRPAASASPASSGPPMSRSASASAFSRATASGSKARSIRVRALRGCSSVREYTTLSLERHRRAKSPMTSGSPSTSIVSHATSTSYRRRPSRCVPARRKRSLTVAWTSSSGIDQSHLPSVSAT
jgi:hypothetical protein